MKNRKFSLLINEPCLLEWENIVLFANRVVSTIFLFYFVYHILFIFLPTHQLGLKHVEFRLPKLDLKFLNKRKMSAPAISGPFPLMLGAG